MYDEMQLAPIDTTSLDWALATLRFILQDTGTPERYTDTELTLGLELRSYTPDSTTYYRPHVAAAHLVTSDPDRAISESIDNASETRRSPDQIAAGILRAYGQIDDLIAAASDYRPPSASFLPVF